MFFKFTMPWIEFGLPSLSINWDSLNEQLQHWITGGQDMETAGDLQLISIHKWSKSPTLLWTSKVSKNRNIKHVCCDAYIPVAKISILVGSWNLVCVSGIYQFSYLQLLSRHILRRPLPNKCVTIQLQEARTLRSPDQAQQVRANKNCNGAVFEAYFIIVS